MTAYLPKIEDYILVEENLVQETPRPSPKKKQKQIKGSKLPPTFDEVDEQEQENEETHDGRVRPSSVGDLVKVKNRRKNKGRVVPLPDIRLTNRPAQKHFVHSPASSPRSGTPSLHRADFNNNDHTDSAGSERDGQYTTHRKARVVFLGDTKENDADTHAHSEDDYEGEVRRAIFGLSPSVGPGYLHTSSPREGFSPYVLSPRDGMSPRGDLSPKDGLSPRDSSGSGMSPRDGMGKNAVATVAGKRLRLKRTMSKYLDRVGVGAVGADGYYRGPLTTPAQIRRKFSQAIKAVMSIRKLAAIMIKKSEEPSAMLKTFNDIIDMSDNFNENLKNKGLSFDPSYFKANKEISISSEVKNILNLPSDSRTPDQVQTAMYGLQSLPSFAEYPLHMQEKLAKVAWYEVVPPKRTIIRQGHYAENFYFILSGQAVVTILIRDPKTNESHVRTANFMRKGTSFGELALLHHSRRTATVTSQDTVQLLSIGRDDFFDIFMSRQGSDEVPEHIKFISHLDFMKGWPLERLLERPEHCLLHFFKRNMVIVKDSKESDWLYIVKSGSCQVLKQLRGVTAKLGIRKHEATLDESFHLPHTGTSIRGPKVDTGLYKPRPKSHRLGLDESFFTAAEDASEGWNLLQAFGSSRNGKLTSRSTATLQLPSLSSKPSSSPSSPRSSPAKNGRKYSKENYSATPITGKAHLAVSHSTPRAPTLAGPRKQGASPPSPDPRTSPRHEIARQPSAPPSPVFVQVSRLKPRDVFGLELVKFLDDIDQQTSVSLVSRGAECIMLSKDFFRRHANEFVKKNLQEIVRPYPDEVTFQESLQRKADWELFKHTLIEDITSVTVS